MLLARGAEARLVALLHNTLGVTPVQLEPETRTRTVRLVLAFSLLLTVQTLDALDRPVPIDWMNYSRRSIRHFRCNPSLRCNLRFSIGCWNRLRTVPTLHGRRCLFSLAGCGLF